MGQDEAKIVCETPTPGKQGTRIDLWKYQVVRDAILKVVARYPDGVTFKDLPEEVREILDPKDRERLGSVVWYTTTVKLDLEVRGEIERVPGAKPQRIRACP